MVFDNTIRNNNGINTEFTELKLEDIAKIRDYFQYSKSRACDDSVGGTFMWRDYFSTEYAIMNETVILKVYRENKDVAFYYPFGKYPAKALDFIEVYCKEKKLQIKFIAVPEVYIDILNNRFKGFSSKLSRDWCDYLYIKDDLLLLKGRKYSAQRNHIHKFKNENDYSTEKLTSVNIEETIDFLKQYEAEENYNNRIMSEEAEKVLEVLSNYSYYNLLGLLLRSSNKIVGFSIGEIVNDTIFIHIEKANKKIHGSYQMLSNLFLQEYADEKIQFINREEDVGDIGLRESKSQYHPYMILNKYDAEVSL
jgi:hypothetical protein